MFNGNDIRVHRVDLPFENVIPTRCSLKANRLALTTTWDGIGNKHEPIPSGQGTRNNQISL